MKREVKHIRGLAKVLNTLADEIERKDRIDNKDLELLKQLGSDILFKGVVLGYSEEATNSRK